MMVYSDNLLPKHHSRQASSTSFSLVDPSRRCATSSRCSCNRQIQEKITTHFFTSYATSAPHDSFSSPSVTSRSSRSKFLHHHPLCGELPRQLGDYVQSENRRNEPKRNDQNHNGVTKHTPTH
ncbi:hypothetical protein G7K_0925-t1 [Saitoella complicata NRRL Y-17804]|uniref:Uncharacterized protein n=1 Tax=Saitoella complicata (strain BCRC 22490 / CBS 7301 / JCM 7358 / NBRC 10748 / NRRL Y-17804) TaxID=698492 RepID=A0A0E9N9Y6_SAICN|nr:hypothetical protein G7K_0925-t1 [Saitoella complicata NRRL Y-17804]